MGISKFSNEVKAKMGYYVYRLIDPRNGQTFYVGKGKGDRVFQHVKAANDDFYEKNEDKASLKIKQIRDIQNDGFEVIHIIQRWGIENEKLAYEIESAIIDCFPGLTNEVAGHHDDHGITNAETIEKVYSAKEYKEPDFPYMIIKIKQDVLDARDSNIYETCRSAWKINENTAKKYKYVICSLYGIVKGVYEVDHWQPDHNNPDDGRLEFVGKEADETIKKIFIDKRLPAKYIKKGMASPVLYSK